MRIGFPLFGFTSISKWCVFFFTLQNCKVNVREIEGTSFRKMRILRSDMIHISFKFEKLKNS